MSHYLKAYRDKFERMNLNEAEIRRKLQIIQDSHNMPIVAAAPVTPVESCKLTDGFTLVGTGNVGDPEAPFPVVIIVPQLYADVGEENKGDFTIKLTSEGYEIATSYDTEENVYLVENFLGDDWTSSELYSDEWSTGTSGPFFTLEQTVCGTDKIDEAGRYCFTLEAPTGASPDISFSASPLPIWPYDASGPGEPIDSATGNPPIWILAYGAMFYSEESGVWGLEIDDVFGPVPLTMGSSAMPIGTFGLTGEAAGYTVSISEGYCNFE